MPFMFEKLEVYQRAHHFADPITVLPQAFLRGHYFPGNR